MLAVFRARSLFARTAVGLAAGATLVLATGAASAVDPVLRHQEDTRGDVRVFGSTLAFDCGAGVSAPAGAVASCASELNVTDTAPDIYFRDNTANASINPTDARTSATLDLPPNSMVTYARLYWSALKQGPDPDPNATLDWLGGPQQEITADQTWVIPYGLPAHPDWYYYQATGDATDFVSTWGAGDFRVSDVESLVFAGLEVDRAFSAWTLVVFYEADGEELRNLALFDGFTAIDPGLAQPSAEVTLDGFVVPQGFTAKMSAITYEGDKAYTGDHFTFNGGQLTDALNPFDNFFNSSRSNLGVPMSGAADVPAFSGAPGSMAGYDLDTVDVTELLNPGDTSATVGADSSLDIFFLGGFVTSVTNLAPKFAVTKTVQDLNGGAVVTGDVLEFTISATNVGNDTGAKVTISDYVGPGMQYDAGSLQITKGGGEGSKTDAVDNDEAEWVQNQKTVFFYVGQNAVPGEGGDVAPGEMVEVKFRVKVTASSGQTLTNQAVLGAEGAAGGPHKDYLSDSDPQKVGNQPLVVQVDQCTMDSQCSGDTPHCDIETHTCIGCQTDADCKDPKAPACQPNGSCGECSATNDKLCIDDKPVCNVMAGVCVLCTSQDPSACLMSPDGPQCVGGMNGAVHCGCFQDSDCGGANSGKVCDPKAEICVDGCKGEGGNGCPDGKECSSKDSTIGACVDVMGTGGSGGSGGGSGTDPGDNGQCGCSIPGGDTRDAGFAIAALGLAAFAARRRKNRSA
ncbi:MAG: MYXO-CTERM sorting domain-containing protein [Polyangiaceae bacterium]